MYDQLLPFLQSGQIEQYAWAMSASVASQILINKATPATQQTELTSKTFQIKLCEGLTAALRAESDSQRQELLARYLCDDVILHEIATAFAKGDFSEASIAALVQSRIPEINSASEIPDFLQIGIRNLINQFNDFVADDSYLTSRALLEMGQQTSSVVQQTNSLAQQTHSAVQQIVHEIQSLKQSDARFTAPPDQASPQQPSVSTASPQLSSISGFSQPFPSNSGSDFIKEDFERGLCELKAGSVRKAKEIFTTVVERLEKLGIDNFRNLYFRAKSNLGISTYLCGDAIDFAITCLDDAFQYSDNSLKGRTNKALVYSLRGDDEKALIILNGILTETPGHFDASAQMADCLGRLGRKAEALSILRAIQTEDTEQKSVLGMTFCGLDDHEYVAITAKSILEKNPDDPWAKYMLAQSIAVPLIERFNEEKLSSAFRTKADRDALQEAITLLEGALVGIRKSDRPEMIAATLSNLSAYCCAGGDIKQSLKYAEEAMNVGKPHKSLLQNRFLAALLGGEYEVALSSAETLGSELPEQEGMALKFECLRALGRNKEALDILANYKTVNPGILLSNRLRLLEVEINLHIPDFETAEALCSQLIADAPDDPFVWLTAANVAHELGNPIEEEHLKKAISLSLQPGLRKEFLGMLGVYYGKQAKWLEALECFLPDVEKPPYNTPYLVEAATCCFNLGRHHQALLLCTAKLDKRYDPAACDLAIQSCLAMFELGKAKIFAERMAGEDYINQPAGWGYLAHIEFRLGKPEEARKLLFGAIKKRKTEVSLLILLSNVCLHLGRSKEALRFAFQALEVADAKHLLNAHRAVVSVGLALTGDASLETEDTQKIQQSLNHLASVDNSGWTAIPFEHDFSALREMLRSQQEAAAEGKRMFSEQGLPVYFLSHMSGRDIYDTWKALTAGQGLHVNMALGSKEEQDTQLKRASTSEGVVLDATALLTFQMLGLLGILPQIFKRVVVSYPTYEYFRDLIAISSFGPQSGGTIALDGDRFQMNEVEPGSKEREKRAFLTPIFEFLNSSSVEKHGFVQPEQLNEVADIFKTTSPQSFASLIVAKTADLPLFCDDAGTLQIAKLGFDLEGFCSQAALRVAVIKGLIQSDGYADAVFQLFDSNYKFVAEDLDTLISYLSRNDWELTPLFKSLIERFDSGEINESVSCRNMGCLLAHAWMRTKSITSDGNRWMSYICERLRSRGSEEDNIRYALVGIATTLMEVPECYVALTHAMKGIDWLPLSFKQSMRQISDLIVISLSGDIGKRIGPAAYRWSMYVQRLS